MNREEHVIHDTCKQGQNVTGISETTHRQTNSNTIHKFTCYKRLVAAGDKERRRARPCSSARRVWEIGEGEEPVADRPVLRRRDLHERGPSGRARQRALEWAAQTQASHRVLVDGDVAARAVEDGGDFRRRRAADGDLQAADDGAEEQREQDQAAVRLAGAPLRIGREGGHHNGQNNSFKASSVPASESKFSSMLRKKN